MCMQSTKLDRLKELLGTHAGTRCASPGCGPLLVYVVRACWQLERSKSQTTAIIMGRSKTALSRLETLGRFRAEQVAVTHECVIRQGWAQPSHLYMHTNQRGGLAAAQATAEIAQLLLADHGNRAVAALHHLYGNACPFAASASMALQCRMGHPPASDLPLKDWWLGGSGLLLS